MVAILGISAFYHDSAAALVVDGQVVSAAQEERFSRIKHDASFPSRAIASCLQIAGLETRDLHAVVFYEKPLLKLDRQLETLLGNSPNNYMAIRWALRELISGKLDPRGSILRSLG